MQSEQGAANCEKFVEVLGLKTFFPAFMGKASCYLHHFPTKKLIKAGRRKKEETRRNILIRR